MRAGSLLKPRRQLLLPQSLMRRLVTELPRSADQAPAQRLANQLFYGTPTAKAGAYYGYSGMGYAGNAEGANTLIKTTSYNVPLYPVSASTPLRKVWTFKSGEPNIEGDRAKVQEDFDRNGGVPLPELALMRAAELGAEGTDKWFVVIRPETDELWEGIGLELLTEGTYAGRWKVSNGHYEANMSRWNGVTAGGSGQGSASGLSLAAGLITLDDLRRVAYGSPDFGHAIGISAIVLENAHVAPARLNDSAPNGQQFLADGTTPNPAFGTVDQVPEGTWCAFPAASRSGDYGITGKLESAYYETIRKYGLYVQAKGGTVNFPIADSRTLFTPYCDVVVDPFRGSEKFEAFAYTGTTAPQRAAWQDASLPQLLPGNINNATNGVLAKMPWRSLELLEPRS